MVKVMEDHNLAPDGYPESWFSHQFRAMGCDMAIWLEAADQFQANQAFAQVEDFFEVNEQAFSRFRPDSELSRLNHEAGRWVIVSDRMWELLNLALDMAALTDGRFDPTILNALEAYGYSVSYEQLAWAVNEERYLPDEPFEVDWTAVELDSLRQAVYLPPGLRLDLGGIAKGYTAMKAVEQLRQAGPCLIDASGDLVAGQPPNGYPGWPVAIAAPWVEAGPQPKDLCNLWLANQALATSGIDFRTWQIGGQKLHHLIDPASGTPASTDALTVTILDDDGASAEAWATATLVAGSIVGMNALLDADAAGLMVTHSGSVLVTPRMQQELKLAPVA